MKRVFIDTSAWYAYFLREDPAHDAVRDAFFEWEGRLVTSNFIFDELVTLCQMRLGHAAAMKVGEALRDEASVELVRLSSDDEDEAWSWFGRHRDNKFYYTDCSSFVLMRRLRIPIAVATDHHFQQAGFQVRPRLIG